MIFSSLPQKLFLPFWGSSFQTNSDTFGQNSDTFWERKRKNKKRKNNFTPSCRMSEFLSKCVWKISVCVWIFVKCVWKLSEFKFVLKVKIFSYRIDSTWSKCVWIFSKCVWTSCVSARHCLERDNIFRQTFCKSVQYITSKCVDFKNYIFWMGKRREKSDTFLVKKSASRHFEKKSFWGAHRFYTQTCTYIFPNLV